MSDHQGEALTIYDWPCKMISDQGRNSCRGSGQKHADHWPGSARLPHPPLADLGACGAQSPSAADLRTPRGDRVAAACMQEEKSGVAICHLKIIKITSKKFFLQQKHEFRCKESQLSARQLSLNILDKERYMHWVYCHYYYFLVQIEHKNDQGRSVPFPGLSLHRRTLKATDCT